MFAKTVYRYVYYASTKFIYAILRRAQVYTHYHDGFTFMTYCVYEVLFQKNAINNIHQYVPICCSRVYAYAA